MKKKKAPWLGRILFGLTFLLLLVIFAVWLKIHWHPLIEHREDTVTVIIDAGHGGADPGTLGQGLFEKQFTLDVALRLQKELQHREWHTKLTRKKDVKVSLEERVAMANETPHAIFISIHFNTSENTIITGAETYFYQDSAAGQKSSVLAQFVQTSVVHHTEADNRGIKSADFYVLHHTRHPAILIEAGFLSNQIEALLISGKNYRQKIAEGIAEGIDLYLKKEAIVSQK